MRQLWLRRTHPWPHRDGAGLGIIDGGPRWGAPAAVVIVVARTVRAIVPVFPLLLALTLAFATVVGGGGRRGRGRLSTQWFLLWWAQRQLLLWRVPSS
jgi:hypothetical protein